MPRPGSFQLEPLLRSVIYLRLVHAIERATEESQDLRREDNQFHPLGSGLRGWKLLDELLNAEPPLGELRPRGLDSSQKQAEAN
jgi:hypothetical protein